MTKPYTVTKWVPTTNLADLRRLGKTGEEAGELSTVCHRCIIQGPDGINPETGKTNMQWLLEELADVQAQVELTLRHFDLDQNAFIERVVRKKNAMRDWEAMFRE